MGATESKFIDTFDEKNAEYGPPMLAHTCRGDDYKYLSWKSAPEGLKNEMREYVRRWICNREAWSATELYIPGYTRYVRKGIPGKPDIAVLYSYAILDEQELIMKMTPHPFTLSSDGRGWAVRFLFGGNPDGYVIKDMEAPLRNDAGELVDPASAEGIRLTYKRKKEAEATTAK